ncbi:MAG: PIN domain-containing protein [Terracidiphilus sp.]
MASHVSLGGNLSRSFIDTNILVYTDDPKDPGKQSRAIGLVLDLLRRGTGVVSLQVLLEYFATATGKLKLAADLAKRRVEAFARLHVVEPALTDILAAIDLHRLHRVSYWDALILRSAKQSGCRILLSEDMQHGQVIDGVRIVNPFL